MLYTYMYRIIRRTETATNEKRERYEETGRTTFKRLDISYRLI